MSYYGYGGTNPMGMYGQPVGPYGDSITPLANPVINNYYGSPSSDPYDTVTNRNPISLIYDLVNRALKGGTDYSPASGLICRMIAKRSKTPEINFYVAKTSKRNANGKHIYLAVGVNDPEYLDEELDSNEAKYAMDDEFNTFVVYLLNSHIYDTDINEDVMVSIAESIDEVFYHAFALFDIHYNISSYYVWHLLLKHYTGMTEEVLAKVFARHSIYLNVSDLALKHEEYRDSIVNLRNDLLMQYTPIVSPLAANDFCRKRILVCKEYIDEILNGLAKEQVGNLVKLAMRGDEKNEKSGDIPTTESVPTLQEPESGDL